jgi:hypothetical protein
MSEQAENFESDGDLSLVGVKTRMAGRRFENSYSTEIRRVLTQTALIYGVVYNYLVFVWKILLVSAFC